VASHNLVGWSHYSQVSVSADGVALMEDVPHKPLGSPTRDDVKTSDELLQVDWLANNNPENGGATILSYHL
jgi:hypothetical protein